MLFPKDFPEKLRSTILVSEVVGKRIKLKQRGKEFLGLCPFHGEKTPSFTVNDQKGFYHCFGCQAHGDVISFVMQSEGLDYKDAVTKLADDFGILIPSFKHDEAREIMAERDYLILEKAAQFFEKNLYNDIGKEARDYLKKRGLNSTIAKKFRPGFSPNSFGFLTDYFRSEGFSEAEFLRTGIVGKNENGKFYDKFRNRIIFPIADKKNRIIAFGGRALGNDSPKYLNSSETEIFKKNRTLYNFFLARPAIFSKGFAVVVEGYMDAISLAANGIENVVAGLGTALGTEHLKELFYITDKIVICLDGDSAGIRAAKRVSEIALPLINAKKNIAFAFLPNQMDPDDFLKEFGRIELEKILLSPVPLSESLFEFAFTELAIDKNKKISAENKAKIEANLNNKIAAIPDAATRKYFSLFFKDLLFSFGKKKKESELNFGHKIYAKPVKDVAEHLGQNIIALMMKFPELAHFRDDQFDVEHLHLSSEKMTQLKDLVIEGVDISALKDDHISEIKNILARLETSGLESSSIRFRILLLKDLLLQVEMQYKESLGQIDEIETHKTAITNQKIKEIFDYKNHLQAMIMALEKELI